MHGGDPCPLSKVYMEVIPALCFSKVYMEVIPALSSTVSLGTLCLQEMPKTHLRKCMWKEWSLFFSCFERRDHD